MEFMQKQLKINPKALSYLKNRGITHSIVEQFCIGFGGTQKDGLFQFLKQHFTKISLFLSLIVIIDNISLGVFGINVMNLRKLLNNIMNNSLLYYLFS
jgi:hypothetical protein